MQQLSYVATFSFQIFSCIESTPLLVIMEDCLEMIDNIFLSNLLFTPEAIDQQYITVLEVYCLLKQRMLDLKKSWRNVLRISFISHKEQYGNIMCSMFCVF